MVQSNLRSLGSMLRLKFTPSACDIVRVMRNSFSAALVLMLCLPSARGACLHWDKFVERPDESAIYSGTLGDHAIRMMLHLDVTTGRFDGAYGYFDQPDVLKLVGYMRAEGIGADLEELNARGRVTGVFSLAFFRPHSEPYAGADWGSDWDFYKKHIRNEPSRCFTLTGVWQPKPWDRKPGQLVRLQGSPGIYPADDKARLQNEVTAYLFVHALILNDRKKVVSLLHYPFRFFDNSRKNGEDKTLEGPESVLQNYDRIMGYIIKTFLANDLAKEEAVPHFLLTDKSGVTDFMNTSVFLYDGKITWICAGACPTIPEIELMGKSQGKH